MQNNFTNDPKTQQGETSESQEPSSRIDQPSHLSSWMQSLLHMGLGESLLRAATNIFSLIAIILVVWLAHMYFRQPAAQAQGNSQTPQVPTPIAAAPSQASTDPQDLSSVGVLRQTDIHTNIPTRARQDIVKYTVQAGDTIIGIAQNFNLQPKTVFSANYALLQDDPHNLRPGQQLDILPVDGVYRQWVAGESIATVAKYYQVTPDAIINYPGNHLDPNTTTIAAGTWIIIPGGVYQYHAVGQIPLGFTRSNPASPQVAGPGACPPTNGGAIGTGTFVYPTDRHYLSGFDYSTKTNHLGIDLAANLGDNIYATDGGVVVYAGANNYGYGNMVMIDHGTGFQSLYAHLSQIFVQCGQSVTQGQVIGAAGATGNASGPHLHFEIRTMTTVIDPWDVLPPRSPAP